MSAHTAIPWDEDGRRECRVCGLPITPEGVEPARHQGERFAPTAPAREDAVGFDAALKAAQSAMTGLPGDAADDDKMRAAVEAIYRAGLIMRRPRPGAAGRHVTAHREAAGVQDTIEAA